MAPIPLQPQVSVVTGVAVGGIGLEVAAGLRAAGHRVIMACRSSERCAAAKAELDARGLPGSCECRQLDLSDYSSVRAFAAGLEQSLATEALTGEPAASHPRLATLVNNAGSMVLPAGPNGECGLMRPNHYAVYALTRLLLPLIAAGGRVVTVASEAHRRGSLRISSSAAGGTGSFASTGSGSSEGQACAGGTGSSAAPARAGTGAPQCEQPLALDGPTPSNWYAAYARSKLCNVLMTAELARHLAQRGSSVTAYSVSPGRVATNIFHNVPEPLATPLRWLAAAAFQTPAQGARTVLHAALAPELAGRSELYLHDQRPCAASAAAKDEDLARQLWRLSNQEVGLSAAEEAALWPEQ